jgi:hypothetical protein
MEGSVMAITITKEITLYNLDELEGSARERALDWLRDDNDFWVEERRATLAAFEKIFPITVKDWEYGYRNHISFTFDYEDEIAELSGIRLMAHIYNNYFSDLWHGKWYYKNKKSRRSKVIFDNCCVLTGYYLDNSILDPIYNFLQHPFGITFYDLLYDCLQSWVYACRDELEYLNSEEYLLETAEANGWLFDEYGRFETA